LSKTETQAAFTAPVIAQGSGRGLPTPETLSGYGRPPLPTATPAPPTVNPADEMKSRAEAARKTGKLGTREESSVYSWREVLPLGIAGFDEKDATGAVVQVREVRFKSTVTGREFTARKNTTFADATLVEVTATGVVFRDGAGTHEVGWSRSRAGATPRASSDDNRVFSPIGRPASNGQMPSGYADGRGTIVAKP
jgi:hypothetical protein